MMESQMSATSSGNAVAGLIPALVLHSIAELCCQPDSVLGKVFAESELCTVIKVTEQEDLGTPEGLSLGLSGVRQDGATLTWVSIPCTGGSVLQAANAHHPGAERRMQRHFALFRKLWKNAVIVMEATLNAGGTVVIEWPTSCSYWRCRSVKAFINAHKLGIVKINGGSKSNPFSSVILTLNFNDCVLIDSEAEIRAITSILSPGSKKSILSN